MPVSTLRTATVAFATAAPCGSATVPVRVAPTIWAAAALASSGRASAMTNGTRSRRDRLSQLDETTVNPNRDRLRAISGAQFLHDVTDVNLRRVFRDRKVLGNIAVAIASGQPSKHLDFATRQPIVRVVLG